MPLRMLDYLSRIVRREVGLSGDENGPRLVSVVIYVGEGAGRGDNGVYQVLGLGDEATLRWQYRPLRLWEMAAEQLFELDNPAFLALVGQTRLSNAQKILPRALSTIRAATEPEQKERLLTALVSLLQTEEVIQMVEKMLEESETLLLDTPYLRRMRELGRQQGREEGREEGRKEGLREAILEAVVRKFDPPASDYRQLEQSMAHIHQADMLQTILLALFDTPDMKAILELVKQSGTDDDHV